MGTFVGHIVPGLALTLLGLWHTFNTIKAYYDLQGKSSFNSRFWYPFFKFRNLELIFIFFFSIFSITMQILDFPLFRFTLKLDNLEHATMFFHLAIYACVTLIVELTHSSEDFRWLVGILVSSVLSQELFLLHYHSVDHVGLEGHYHCLFQLIVQVSLVSAVAMTSFPRSFLAAFVLSITVLFQGCWFMNMGFMLWIPRFIPKGCMGRLGEEMNDMHGAVMCNTDEALMRANALANLQFSWILAGIMMLTACLCLALAGKRIKRSQSIQYEQLHSRVSDATQIPMDVYGSTVKS